MKAKVETIPEKTSSPNSWYQTDVQRKQGWNEAVFTYNKMIQTYRGYRYDLIEVPKATVAERADFILDHIKGN